MYIVWVLRLNNAIRFNQNNFILLHKPLWYKLFSLSLTTYIKCFKFPNSVVVRFIVTFTKFPIRHLNPHVYYYVEKMQLKKNWKTKESLSHEYKRSRRHTTVIFLSIYVTYWKPSPNLAPYHLSLASVASRRDFCHII